MESFLQGLFVFTDNTVTFILSQLVIFIDIMGLWVLNYFWRILKHHSLEIFAGWISRLGNTMGLKFQGYVQFFYKLADKENQQMIEYLESERS